MECIQRTLKKKGKEKYKANFFSHVSEFLHISWKEQTLIFITEDVICFCWITYNSFISEYLQRRCADHIVLGFLCGGLSSGIYGCFMVKQAW